MSPRPFMISSAAKTFSRVLDFSTASMRSPLIAMAPSATIRRPSSTVTTQSMFLMSCFRIGVSVSRPRRLRHAIEAGSMRNRNAASLALS